jgi:hypothetical protein
MIKDLIKILVLIISVVFFLGWFPGCDKKPKNMPKVQKSGKVRPAKKAITQGSSQKRALPSEKDSNKKQDADTSLLTPTPKPSGEPASDPPDVKPKRKLKKKPD